MIRRKFKKQLMGAGVDRWGLRLLNSTNEKVTRLIDDYDYQQGIEDLDWEHKDTYYQKYQDSFKNEDQKFWLAKTLHLNGSLTHKELWKLYTRDEDIDKERIHFRSQSHLKRWLLTMLEYNEIVRAGFSKKEKRPLGFAVNTREAFKEYHPALIFSMDPAPQCYTQMVYSKYFEGEIQDDDEYPQIGSEKPELIVK